ncbi:arginine--tRNA ligase, partial [Candidatus Omnitrophota bacterium]
MNIIDNLTDILKRSLELSAKELEVENLPEVIIEVPKDRRLADLSTNVAMQVCKLNKGMKPLEVAGIILDKIKSEIKADKIESYFEKLEVKPPGFINFYLSNYSLQNIITQIQTSGPKFGMQKPKSDKKVLIEFVSANPTGPLSVAHGRQAAVGDALANILEFVGYSVKREYYLNDEGNQILLLGKSIHARYCELLGETTPFPEQGYRGRYIYDIAKEIVEKRGTSHTGWDSNTEKLFCSYGVESILSIIKKDLDDFGVHFDNYFSQAALTKSGNIEKAVSALKDKGYIYEKDNAVWFESIKFGDDKDRVIKKSDGSYTYVTPDIAYHEDKFKRGFNWLIDLWGPDHHGYISRIKSASLAFGRDAEALSLLIVQLATLSRAGKPVRMSTREGEFITLREVIDEVGKDVARFFFLVRRKDSHLDFDLELAKKESMDNPIYYIQYAHARICGILEYKRSQKIEVKKADNLSLINTEEELNILRILREFPDVINWSAQNLEPHRVITYLMELAGSFHHFYNKHRVVGDD